MSTILSYINQRVHESGNMRARLMNLADEYDGEMDIERRKRLRALKTARARGRQHNHADAAVIINRLNNLLREARQKIHHLEMMVEPAAHRTATRCSAQAEQSKRYSERLTEAVRDAMTYIEPDNTAYAILAEAINPKAAEAPAEAIV